MKTPASLSCVTSLLIAGLVAGGAATPQSSSEAHYIESRDAAIKKLKPLYDAGAADDAASKTDDAARADLEGQLRAILGPQDYEGFGSGKLNLDSLYEGDEGFGALDGLRFDSNIGNDGQTAGVNDANGHYIEPKSHIIVTTQSLFARWLRGHQDWWDKGLKNVPQQIGAALKNEGFYTQAISTGAALVKFNDLPITKRAAATFAYAMLAARTQSDVPADADEAYASALANGKVYIAYGSIDPAVEVAACAKLHADDSPRGETAFKRCFIAGASKQPAFTAAAKQAQALLDLALGK
jgi:hypothetical protein